MLGDMRPCKDMGADAWEPVFSCGRRDLAPTIFGEGIGVGERILKIASSVSL